MYYIYVCVCIYAQTNDNVLNTIILSQLELKLNGSIQTVRERNPPPPGENSGGTACPLRSCPTSPLLQVHG